MKKILAAGLAVFLIGAFGGAVTAFASEFRFEVIADGREYVFYSPELYMGRDGVELAGIDGVVQRIADDSYVAPVNASLQFLPEGQSKSPFTVQGEKNGRGINAKLLKAKIEYALACGERTVQINSEVIRPAFTLEDALSQTKLVASFSTGYALSQEGRKHNISLAASKLNGAIIDSGSHFSFNERVGKRTEELGYKSAKVITDGRYTDGTGGGVCQVSTTLYNALLMAGLTPVESHRHTLRVEYVSPSFDAMVSDGGSDLKFFNPFDTPVYVCAFADGESLQVKIYGKDDGCEYRLVSEVVEVIKAKITEVEPVPGEPLPQPVNAKDGLKSKGYVHVYKQGRLIEVRQIRTDTYLAVDGIKIKGEIEEQ